MVTLAGKVVVVTGAASGIGTAVARLLAAAGARMVLADIAAEDGAALARELEGVFWQTDVTQSAEPERLAKCAVDRFGRLDVLVNSAGIVLTKPTTETTLEEWNQVIAVNLTGTWLCSQAAIPRMVASGGGAIVNIASTAGLVGFAGAAAYCASKGGVVQLTKAMALDCAPLGIRVNAVCPGHTRTPLADRFVGAQIDPAAFLGSLVAQHPLGRMAEPAEIAACVAFLAGEEASFVTGAVLAADGGFTAR